MENQPIIENQLVMIEGIKPLGMSAMKRDGLPPEEISVEEDESEQVGDDKISS